MWPPTSCALVITSHSTCMSFPPSLCKELGNYSKVIELNVEPRLINSQFTHLSEGKWEKNGRGQEVGVISQSSSIWF